MCDGAPDQIVVVAMTVLAALAVTAVVSAPVPRRHVFNECGTDYDPSVEYCPFFVATASAPSYCCMSLAVDVLDTAPYTGLDCEAANKYRTRCSVLVTTDKGAMCCSGGQFDLGVDNDYWGWMLPGPDAYDAYSDERGIPNGYPYTGWD
jgi:hypothetical protein